LAEIGDAYDTLELATSVTLRPGESIIGVPPYLLCCRDWKEQAEPAYLPSWASKGFFRDHHKKVAGVVLDACGSFVG
jgi:hypothetical protein